MAGGGVGVGLGVVSVAGSEAGGGSGVGVGDGGGFTGADGVELLGYVECCGVLGGATSVPAAVFMAARKVCADWGACTEPVRMLLKSIMRP